MASASPKKNTCPDKGTAPGKRIAVIIWANEQDHVPRMVREKNPGMRHLFSKVAVHSFMQKPSDLGNTKGVLASFLGYRCKKGAAIALTVP